ncbi:hypothetical protein LR48_Vigan07g157700 [Vigna angularis]|uniref:Uncharacterized protein n=1 Tax=Phaseolus angularis TaxID=3914 RepID=A0A0L9UYL2_PHAAN|nr:hypothetical protein LR48_Vigan07g157700 [Vigna angularis]
MQHNNIQIKLDKLPLPLSVTERSLRSKWVHPTINPSTLNAQQFSKTKPHKRPTIAQNDMNSGNQNIGLHVPDNERLKRRRTYPFRARNRSVQTEALDTGGVATVPES